jgi:RNA polymerase sigma factor (sigma-70 family)
LSQFNAQIEKAVKNARGVHRDDFDDLRQECRLALFLATDRLETAPTPDEARALAYTICANKSVDFIRQSVSKQVQTSLGPTEELNPWQENMAQVLSAERARLPEQERFVLEALFFEGLSERELSRRMGWTRKRVAQIKLSGLTAIWKALA